MTKPGSVASREGPKEKKQYFISSSWRKGKGRESGDVVMMWSSDWTTLLHRWINTHRKGVCVWNSGLLGPCFFERTPALQMLRTVVLNFCFFCFVCFHPECQWSTFPLPYQHLGVRMHFSINRQSFLFQISASLKGLRWKHFCPFVPYR